MTEYDHPGPPAQVIRYGCRLEFTDVKLRWILYFAGIPGGDLGIYPGDGRRVIDPAMHLRGPCVLALAKRDLGYKPRHSIEMGVRDWVQEEANHAAAELHAPVEHIY